MNRLRDIYEEYESFCNKNGRYTPEFNVILEEALRLDSFDPKANLITRPATRFFTELNSQIRENKRSSIHSKYRRCMTATLPPLPPPRRDRLSSMSYARAARESRNEGTWRRSRVR